MSDALNPADLTSENAELRARLAETEAILLTIRHGVAEAPVISTPPAERQQTEAEVRRQEEQLRLITDAIPALIAYVDAQQRYQFNNQAYEQWFGDRPEELKGRHLRDVLGQAAYTTLLPYIEKALGGQPTMYEQWVPYEDGGLRYIHATYIPHVGPNGETLGFYALVNDITERKQPEEALRASEERFRALANAVPSIVWTAAPDGSITFANDQWFHYVGITPEQNAREWPELVLHPDDYERCVAEWTRALREGTEYRIEVRNRRYDGVHRWFQTRAVPVRDAEGRISAWYGVTTDIHERKLAEGRVARLQEITAALSKALTPQHVGEVIIRQGCAALGASSGALLLLAEDGEALELVNALGYSEELINTIRRVSLSGPNLPVLEVLRTGEPIWLPSQAAFNARYPDHAKTGNEAIAFLPLRVNERNLGSLIISFAEVREFSPEEQIFLLTLARHCAQALERARLFAETQTLNDELEKRVQKRTAQLLAANARLETEVAERRQIAEQLELSREQLRRLALHLQAVREEERTHLAREVHDAVGQLLTGLKMDVAWLGHRLAEDGSPRVDKVREMTELLDSAIKSVRQIATELRPAILDDIGLAAAIEWQVREFESRSGIACRYTSTLEEIPLEAEHSTAVFRLVQETLTNVARHAQASQVEISLGEVDGFLSLQVRDNGRGITEEELRGSKSLGLLGMRERAQRLAGQLGIQGAPGQGTTVTMRVPLSVRLESDAYAS